ncbi:MAG: outer-membrane lipoprotein carrier protein LolA, partial [Pseudomonadales bacterium]|nr:outer-membrane lipoprotein carrier protein LolA [Pseudomonadales bacterium]
FYWQADEPAAQLLVCDGQTIWHFDEDLEQVVVQKYAQAKYQSPLLLILEEEGALREKFDVSLVTQAPLLVFTLTPKKIQGQQNEAMAVSSIELGFSDNKLQSLSFVDALKQKTQVNFTEVVIDQVIDDKRFTFDIPVDADVLYE